MDADNVDGLRLSIDTPFHKMYRLPDNCHCVDIHYYERFVHMSVRNERYNVREQMTVYYAKTPRWQDVVAQFKELAVRKYPRNIMKRGDMINQIARRF